MPKILCSVCFAILLVLAGCKSQPKGPNLESMWDVSAPAPTSYPLRVTILGPKGSLPKEDEKRLLTTTRANLADVAKQVGLEEVLQIAKGETVAGSAAAEVVADDKAKKKSDKDKEKESTEKEALQKQLEANVNTLALMAGDLGIAAVEQNDLQTAANSLDLALLIMTSFASGGEKSVQNAMKWKGSESMKAFKGEPHERALIFIWRGLTYIAAGDYENARACFMSANLEDQFAKDEKTRAGWFVADLLERQASVWAADGMEKGISERMAQAYPGAVLPTATPEQRIMMLFAVGYPPCKKAGNRRGDLLTYERELTSPAEVHIAAPNGSKLPVAFAQEDVAMQAYSRGKRAMDAKNAEKATRSDRLTKGGDIMESVGGSIPYVGIFFQVGGQSMRARAARVRTYADTRGLQLIPSDLYIAFLKPADIPAGSRLQMVAKDGAILAEAAVPVAAIGDKPSVVLARYEGEPQGSVAIGAPATDTPTVAKADTKR